MELQDSSILTNIYSTGDIRPNDQLFEKKYITTRAIENRLYSDEELINLPDIAATHSHYREWQLRKRSAQRLIAYFTSKRRPLRLLEIGCGNGWLAHRLAGIPGTEVTGLDINFTELQQAARVFSDDPNLRFIHGDIRTGMFGEQLFDGIVFAASVQYFQSLKKIIYTCLKQLAPGGEIHIIDSPLYQPGEITGARIRTTAYYNALGYPEMAGFYFHHNIRDLGSFNHSLLYDPHHLHNRWFGNRGPFPWIRIRALKASKKGGY